MSGPAAGFAVAWIAELAFLSCLLGWPGPLAGATCWFAAALAQGLLGVVLSSRGAAARGARGPRLAWLPAAAVFAVLLPAAGRVFASTRPEALSDILPQIGILVQRWLDGEFPYRWILPTEWSFPHALFPTFLPLHWLPFALPEWLGIDFRWLPLAALALATLGYTAALRPPWPVALAAAVLPAAFATFDRVSLVCTVELLIVAYTLAFTALLGRRSALARAAGALPLLLSRYALVLWMPLWLGVVAARESPRRAAAIAAWLALGVLALYGLPFLARDPGIYWDGYRMHSTGALVEWTSTWGPSGRPYQLSRGLGFALLFQEHAPGDLAARLLALQRTHFALCVATVAALSLWFWSRRQRMRDPVLVVLASFKLYLTVFYAFLQIPYSYLFWVPLAASLPLWARVCAWRPGERETAAR